MPMAHLPGFLARSLPQCLTGSFLRGSRSSCRVSPSGRGDAFLSHAAATILATSNGSGLELTRFAGQVGVDHAAWRL